ncbi:MAG: DUF2975 domain-containing protein [Bacteroidaceae bacterium]|nr:DUF2975 domain-containing protein [Bacteroidaceae bacterium]
MKNRVYLYCIIFAVVFVATFSFDVFNAASEFRSGWQEQGSSREVPELTLELNSSNVGTIHNKKTNKYLKIYRKNLIVETGFSCTQTNVAMIVSAFLAAFGGILLIINAILTLISIGKKDIFNNRFEKRLCRIGIGSILIYTGYIVFGVVEHVEACKQFDIEGYYHKLLPENSFTGIYIGLILLIGAQVFKMARTLQEEQDLTI